MARNRPSRFLLIAGVLSCAVLLMAGCGGGSIGQGASKVRITVSFTTGADERRALEAVADEFMRDHPGILVKPIYITGGYYDKVKTMVAGHNAPDIMWMGQGFAEFATRGAFLPIDNLYGHIDPDDYYMEVVNWYKLNGKLYGFPYGVDFRCIFYNKDLFDDAGVPYPREDWTVEEFLDTAQKLTRDIDGDGHIDQYGFQGQIPIGAYGDAILNEDHTRCLLDTPQSIRLHQLDIDLVNKYKVSPPRESELRSMGSQISFLMGRLAMWDAMNLMAIELRRTVDAFDWDIAKAPKGTEQCHWASSSGFAVARTTKHPKEAVELLKVLCGRRFVAELKGYSIPVEKAHAREMADNWQGPPAHFHYLLDMVHNMKPNPRDPDINQILDIMNRHLQRAEIGEVTVAEALEAAAAEIDQLLAERRK
ncbi:MAG: sugar ABC transporter substrate-binding protein [Planctomycetota bacterium]